MEYEQTSAFQKPNRKADYESERGIGQITCDPLRVRAHVSRFDERQQGLQYLSRTDDSNGDEQYHDYCDCNANLDGAPDYDADNEAYDQWKDGDNQEGCRKVGGQEVDHSAVLLAGLKKVSSLPHLGIH